MDVVRENFEVGKKEWVVGNRIQLIDPKDAIAWYIFQAQAGASKRQDWYEPDAFRISPIFNRLGNIIPDLQGISGIEDRIQTLLTRGKSQPDDGLLNCWSPGRTNAAIGQTWHSYLNVPAYLNLKTFWFQPDGAIGRWSASEQVVQVTKQARLSVPML